MWPRTLTRTPSWPSCWVILVKLALLGQAQLCEDRHGDNTRSFPQEDRNPQTIRRLQAAPSLFIASAVMVMRKTRIEEDLIGQLTQSSEKRLARALLLLAGRGSQSKAHAFAGISQGTRGTMIGNHTERVSISL